MIGIILLIGDMSASAQISSTIGIIGIIAILVLKREFNRIMEAVDRIPTQEIQARWTAAVERIPSAETFREWSEKLDAFDPRRLDSHYAAVHAHATTLTTHGFRLDQHDKRISSLEVYDGPERRKVPRE